MVLIAATLLPYLPSLTNGFVWLDTEYLLRGAIRVADAAEFLQVLIEGHPGTPHYHRPLVGLLMSVTWALWGQDALPFHIQSVVLHITCVLLAFQYMRRWLADLSAAAAALLWGVLPAGTAVVCVIQSASDSMALGFVLACLLSVERYLEARVHQSQWLLAIGGFLIAALLSKETSFALPLFLVPFLLLRKDGHARERILLASATVLVSVGAFGSYYAAVANPAGIGSGALLERVLSFIPVYVHYVTLTFTSIQLTVSDTTARLTSYGEVSPLYLGAFASIWLAQALAFRKIPSSRGGLLWFNVFLLPVAQLVPLLHFRADRFLYVPAVGLVWALTAMADHFVSLQKDRALWSRRFAAAAGLVVLLFFGRIVARSADFDNDLTLFEREVERTASYREGHSYLGLHFARLGPEHYQRAQQHFRLALTRSPDEWSYVHYSATLANATALWLDTKQDELAYDWLSSYRKRYGSIKNEALLYNLSVACIRLKKWPEAIQHLIEYRTRYPKHPGAIFLLGKVHLRVGDTHEAHRLFSLYVALFPNSPDRAKIEEYISRSKQQLSK